MRLLLLLIVMLALPSTLRGQAAALRVEADGAAASVPVAQHRGYPAYPATALRHLGARLEETPRGARAVLFGDTLVVEALSPFLRAGGRIHQLAAPAYLEGGVLYLPHQLFVEWLPARYPDRLGYAEGTLRLAGAERPAGRAARPEPARPVEPGPRVVVIDAGHGGRDPGKPGSGGVHEKDVALSVALRLAEVLRTRGGYEVHLTRTDDTLVPLSERPRLANEWKAGRPASLFISLHANSGPRGARGFETFFLSEARTDDERRVAEMENAAVAFEDNGAAASGDELTLILNGLRNNFYMRASNDLAEVIQRRLDPIHPGPNRGVKQAGLVVLVGAFMPAVLVEMAFISDRREEQFLKNSGNQRRIARVLADAVDEFFGSHEHLWRADGGG